MTSLFRQLRERFKTPITDSADMASVGLQQLRANGQFAVFDLPARATFVQAMRTTDGSLLIEVSQPVPEAETLLERLGKVSRNELGFLTVMSAPGNDPTCGQVVAEALAVLAGSAGCENLRRTPDR